MTPRVPLSQGTGPGEAVGQLGLRWSEAWGKGVSCESTPGIRGYPEDLPHLIITICIISIVSSILFVFV